MKVTQKRIAKLLGISTRAVRYHISDGMPTHDLVAANDWYLDTVDQTSTNGQPFRPIDLWFRRMLPRWVRFTRNAIAGFMPTNATEEERVLMLGEMLSVFLDDIRSDLGGGLVLDVQTNEQLGIADDMAEYERLSGDAYLGPFNERAEAYWKGRGEMDGYMPF